MFTLVWMGGRERFDVPFVGEFAAEFVDPGGWEGEAPKELHRARTVHQLPSKRLTYIDERYIVVI